MVVNEVILELMVKDVSKTVKFYTEMLGFTLLASEEDDQNQTYWAKVRFRDFLMSFKEEKRLRSESQFMAERQVGGSISICVVVDEIEPVHAELENQFKMLDYPHLTPCGATQFSLMDVNGYILTFEKLS